MFPDPAKPMTIKPRLPAHSSAQSREQPSNQASVAATDLLGVSQQRNPRNQA
jgi:hypothetical protein